MGLSSSDPRFAFGANWKSFSKAATQASLEEARNGLATLLGTDDLSGRTFLDIGSGSGIHALAALSLGAAQVCAVDIDRDSVEATETMLRTHASGAPVSVFQHDILGPIDPLPASDVVYSWGVLHHTGNLELAMQNAAACVAPGGLFAFALYRKTLCCPLWTLEKRWYVRASDAARQRAHAAYRAAYRVGLRVIGQRYDEYVASYRSRRGMDFAHDVADWLGGYPYESIAPAAVERRMRALGFEPVWCNVREDVVSRLGLLGSGCDEYVYRRGGRGRG